MYNIGETRLLSHVLSLVALRHAIDSLAFFTTLGNTTLENLVAFGTTLIYTIDSSEGLKDTQHSNVLKIQAEKYDLLGKSCFTVTKFYDKINRNSE